MLLNLCYLLAPPPLSLPGFSLPGLSLPGRGRLVLVWVDFFGSGLVRSGRAVHLLHIDPCLGPYAKLVLTDLSRSWVRPPWGVVLLACLELLCPVCCLYILLRFLVCLGVVLFLLLGYLCLVIIPFLLSYVLTLCLMAVSLSLTIFLLALWVLLIAESLTLLMFLSLILKFSSPVYLIVINFLLMIYLKGSL